MTYQAYQVLAEPDVSPPPRLSVALRRQRCQLSGALLLGLVVPYLARFGADAVPALGENAIAMLPVLAGIVISHFIIRQFSTYPGETPFTTAMPGASMGFAVVVVWLILGHMPYSRSLLIWGYLSTVAWYVAVGFVKGRYFPPRLALVPHGRAPDLMRLGRADWMCLAAPVPLDVARFTNGLVADLSADLSAEWRDFVLSCGTAGIPVFDSTRAREMMTGQVELASLAHIGFDANLPHRSYVKFKSLIDFAAAVALLPLALPVIAATAAAIRLESKGPALFVQKRVGYRGQIFNCYKLRSMHLAAEDAGPSFTAEEDPRITRVGRFIRKYRIDELPQIFNILKGEMSWIGPRPEAVPLAQLYGRSIPFYAFRHSVKPGISGWAAIRQGNVADVDAATAKLRYDFYYIKNLSPSLDALIAARTIWTMLTGFGSK